MRTHCSPLRLPSDQAEALSHYPAYMEQVSIHCSHVLHIARFNSIVDGTLMQNRLETNPRPASVVIYPHKAEALLRMDDRTNTRSSIMSEGASFKCIDNAS